jgi:hypothetical protein
MVALAKFVACCQYHGGQIPNGRKIVNNKQIAPFGMNRKENANFLQQILGFSDCRISQCESLTLLTIGVFHDYESIIP